jgi:hypothetical protein
MFLVRVPLQHLAKKCYELAKFNLLIVHTKNDSKKFFQFEKLA